MKIVMNALASAAAVATLATAAHAEPLDPSIVPNNAKWVIHVDADALTDSALAERFRERHPDKVKGVQKWLESRYGINPREDLKSLTLFSDNYRPHSGAIIVRAKYDPEKVKQTLEQAGAKTTAWEDYTIYTHTSPKHACKHDKAAGSHGDKHADSAEVADANDEAKPSSSQAAKPHGKKTVATVLFDDQTIVFAATPDRIKPALRLLLGEEDSLEDADSPLIADLPTGAIFYGAAIDLGELSEHVRPFPVLQQHEQVRVAFGQQGDELFKQVTLVAKEPQVAREMKTALEGFVALAKVCAGDAETVAELYDNVEIERDGATVEAAWEGDVDDVMQALDEIEPRLAAWRKMHHERH